jgi:beta-lactamase class A
MIGLVRGLAVVLLLPGCAAAPEAPPGLRSRVLAALAPAGGEWGVYFKDLQSGAELAVRADEDFHPASTLKIWVLVKVFQDVEDGKYFLDDEVEVTRTFRSAARNDPRPFEVEASVRAVADAVGKRMKVAELAEHMITASDNLATNNLIRLAGGPEAIHATLSRYGVFRSNVRRYIMDLQAFGEGLSSVARPREFGAVLERMAEGRVVSPSASRDMLALLSRLKDNAMLPGKLPAGTRVAHKTGAIEGVRCDVGLVWLPGGRRYIACFFSRGLKDERRGEACLAEASRLLYDFVAR